MPSTQVGRSGGSWVLMSVYLRIVRVLWEVGVVIGGYQSTIMQVIWEVSIDNNRQGSPGGRIGPVRPAFG